MRIVLLLPLLLAACATFPEIDAAERGLTRGPAPVLLPTDDLLARTATPQTTAATEDALLARAAALKARAEALRAASGA